MVDSQIYAKQLLLRRHGYPLWIPEPFGHSSVYRTKGVRIGDVGYVTQDGGFQTLFNIRASPSDPINRRGVPEGFQQVCLDSRDIDHVSYFHPPNGAVTSVYAEQRGMGTGIFATQVQPIVGAGAALKYVWSSAEGAILHLPNEHAESWYEFALAHSDISNGSLYLITGCDKTNSWMVGAFSGCSSGSQAALELSVAGLVQGNLSYNYSWTRSIPAAQRVGPLVDQRTADDEDPDALETDKIFAEDAPEGRNQCAFIRGYKIALKKDAFRRILGIPTIEISSIENAIEEDIHRHSSPNATSLLASLTKGKGKMKASEGHRRSGGEDWERDRESEYDSTSDSDDVRLEQIPGPCEDCHPSTLINNFKLKKYANIKVVVTHDDDWIDLIDENDRLWPTDNELLLRLENRRALRHNDNDFSNIYHRDIHILDSSVGRPLTYTRGGDDRKRLKSSAYRSADEEVGLAQLINDN